MAETEPNIVINNSPLADVQSATLNDFIALVEAGQVPSEIAAYEAADAGMRLAYLVPEDHQLEVRDFEKLALHPRRPTGTIVLRDAISFIEYVNAYKKPGTIVVADKTSMTAVFNHHIPGEETVAGWSDFRAKLELHYSDAWTRWREFANRFQEPEIFATFLENNRQTIVEPDTGLLLDLTRNIQVTSKMTFTTATRAGNNTSRLEFDQEDDARAGSGKKFDVVDGQPVKIQLPLYVGGDPIQIHGRLSYYIKNVSGRSHIYWRVELFGIDEAEELATKNRIDRVSAAIGQRVLLGSV